MSRAARGKCIVRKVTTAETLGGGKIILPEAVRDKMTGQQVIVENVGDLALCPDRKKCQRPAWMHVLDDPPNRWFHLTPVGLTVGAWCLIRPRVFIPFSDTEPVYLVHHDDILAIFHVE